MSTSSLLQTAISVLCLLLSGCSAIGLTVGALIDVSQPDTDIFFNDIEGIVEFGDSIAVVTTDSKVRHGAYEGTRRIDSMGYAAKREAYLRARAESNALLASGDTVVLFFKSRTPTLPHVYCGAEGDSLRFVGVDRTPWGSVWVSSLAALQRRDSSFVDLSRLAATNRVRPPSDRSIVLDDSGGPVSIPLEEIRYVEKEREKGAIWRGLEAGAALDVLIVAEALYSVGK